MRVTALASGSSGNAFLVEVGTTSVLLDAGLPGPALERYLWQRGVAAADLSAIFVSHEHIDHLRGVGALARRHGIPVVANAATLRAGAALLGPLPEPVLLPVGGACQAGPIQVRTFPLSHDAAETVGFWVQAEGAHACICTDLGLPTAALTAPLAAADLLVLEANHDLDRLWAGPYPPALKARIAGPRGHLANVDAARLVLDLARDPRPRTIWLAHLSATNNTPRLAYEAVAAPLAQAGYHHYMVAVAGRDRPSLVWDSVVAPAARPAPPQPALRA
ncbi:MAG TPA: MBL fold metallo-hydrolase [Chloroflexia bacterium]|nr:MBL fold metallo-hydrolase [Chloroflexia bacterium]